MHLIGKRILINVVEPIDQTLGGIYIPQAAQKPRDIGSVVAIGDTVDQWLIANKHLKEGETVLDKEIKFHIQSAQTFEHHEIKLKLIFVTDIIAIL